MNRFSLFIILLVMCSQNLINASKLPSFINPCYRDEPNLGKCLAKEAKRVLSTFADGIPEMGVDPLDPLQLGDFDIITPTNKMKITNKNAVMIGYKNFNVVRLDIDAEKKTGVIRLKGNCTFKSDYSIDGRILVFPIIGNGLCSIDMYNLDLILNWDWELYTGKDGLQYAITKKTSNQNKIGSAKIKMGGLFNGDKELGAAMDRILNENWKLFVDEVGPPAIKILEKKVTKIINQFYSQVPYDDLVPLKSAKK